ncbi:hypothetical protein LTR09_000492 [Extremus antarcticus]|uniref:non-specific serine/threonine protein kinase n=1 Tax=Extremus antarcticus TaxID=702011 RepID=A0AAJ0GJQ9_9PEZI|nr:hypothetical protein LTR09_000492 [Extremus antarcticus]
MGSGKRQHDHVNSSNDDLTPMRHDSKQTGDAGDDSNAVTPQNGLAANHNATTSLHALDTTTAYSNPKSSTPASAGLSIKTNMRLPPPATAPFLKETPTFFETPVTSEAGFMQHHLASPTIIPILGSSLRSALSTSSIASSVSPSTASVLASPYLAAMTDITPLPSPLMRSESAGSLFRRSLDRPRTPSRSSRGSMEEQRTPVAMGSQHSSASSPPKRKKGYGSLLHDAVETSLSRVTSQPLDESSKKNKEGHGRNRSISDFVPELLQNTRQRHVTFGEGDSASFEAQEYHMQRELNLAAQRGLTVPLDAKSQRQLPSPPPSNSSVAASDEADDDEGLPDGDDQTDYLEIHCGLKNKRRKFRQLRQLGEGTFSKVVLATRQRMPQNPTPEIEDHLDPHKLVAVKIVEHGPAGGADEQRIETSLKREVEMLKSVSHPSLVHLKACEYQETRALLVLTYCPGGDLFELASQKRELLTPPMIQRIFSELICAVRYLHSNWIVHRDIKLENVLVNVSHQELATISNPLTHPTPLITLTDLGLSRRIPQPPESPLLSTRCGSEDYAAPEILLGQPYDGRQTDAWALGVLLYALMEGRLPFDAPPGKPDRSRNTHRIARCDWIWCRYGDEDGEWDPSRGEEFEGAQHCVERLLKKVRMGRKPLEDVEGYEWGEQTQRLTGVLGK